MQHPKRTTDTCPFRRQLQASGGEPIATCQLLQEVSRVRQPEWAQVDRQACDACCETFTPTTTDLNAVVASHLFVMAEQIIDAGGVDGCPIDRARELHLWAEKSLPAVAANEDDCTDIARESGRDYSFVTVEQIEQQLPRPTDHPESAVKHWAVGVTSAPRRIATLPTSLDAMEKAGWDSATFFLDGDVEVPAKWSHLPQCHRKPAVGAFGNYMLSLAELMMRDPHADAYFILQDDALPLATSALRPYLERMLFPVSGPCIVSLYCSSRYTRDEAGWHRFDQGWVWGAVAFVFSPEAAKALLASPRLPKHRALPDEQGRSRVDVLIGQVADELAIPIYFPSPSLVQHIGNISTIWETCRAVSSRRADHFIGDLLLRP